MPNEITAKQVIDLIKDQLRTTWKESPADTFQTGEPDTPVTGIVTSFTPSIEVLKRSVAAGKNLIITQQPAFYLETEEYLKNDPAFLFKKDFINKNKLVIWRFYDNWNYRGTDGQLLGLAKALGWEKYHIQDAEAASRPYAPKNKYFKLPEGSLKDKMAEIKDKLKIKGIRVIGDPDTRIRKASLSHGMFKFQDLQDILKDPEVDLLVLAEAIEWESPEYFRDMLTWQGKKKAMIIIGREAAEDPGYGEVATWLKTFISSVSIEWISAREPFWIP